jgi:hypothetical protein
VERWSERMSNIPGTKRLVDLLMAPSPIRVLRWLLGWDLFSQLESQLESRVPRVFAPQGEPVSQQR